MGASASQTGLSSQATEPVSRLGSDELRSLARRCEAATGADRSIDGDIAAALALHPPALTIRGNRQPELFKDNAPGLHAKTWLAPNFTASLDAAMTLVPEGFHINNMCEMRYIGGDRPYSAQVDNWQDTETKRGTRKNGLGRTYALALCAAALRARDSDGTRRAETA